MPQEVRTSFSWSHCLYLAPLNTMLPAPILLSAGALLVLAVPPYQKGEKEGELREKVNLDECNERQNYISTFHI